MNEPNTTPAKEFLCSILDYDPDTGIILWRRRSAETFTNKRHKTEKKIEIWNNNHAGRPAGTVCPRGYIAIFINGQKFRAHRLMWKMTFGVDPDVIDHINRDPSDNRIDNLRSVSQAENARNRRMSSRNTSGVSGVYPKRGSKWYAVISENNKQRSLGTFATFAEAVQARLDAESLIHLAQIAAKTALMREAQQATEKTHDNFDPKEEAHRKVVRRRMLERVVDGLVAEWRERGGEG